MSMIKSVPKREDVPELLTWDLKTMYASDEQWEEDLQKANEKIEEVANLKGSLDQGADALVGAIQQMLDMLRQVENIYVYSHLKNDQDTSNSKYQALNDRASQLYTQASTAISWFEPEILSLGEEKLAQYFEENSQLEDYRHFIENITSSRAHVLSADKEALIAKAGDVLGASSKTFSVLNNADLTFPTITDENGEEVQLSHGNFVQFLESSDVRVRREAFEKMYGVYKGLINTFASTMQGNVKLHNFNADIRNYDSARHAALASNHIPESVYDTLLEVVGENLPLLHRYMQVRKDLLGLDELHMYDLYTPILKDGPKFTYDEAREMTLKSLSIMGEDYQRVLHEAFDQRWIDVVENQGKRSGAYSSGSYDSYPYILLNWHDSLDNLYTLVHELGHSVHSYLTRKYQPYVYGDYSIFLAEIASTTNENLLTDYLLKESTSDLEKAHILNHYLDGFKGTVFRQTQFAEFEHLMHEEAAKGTPLTADFLNSQYSDMNDRYYGSSVVNDDEIAYEWSRIPHFYMNHYVYQYATGFCAATALADKIASEEKGALDAYLNYLKSGSSDFPIDIMKKAGVDMTSRDYIDRAMKVFEKRLEQFEAVVAKLKK